MTKLHLIPENPVKASVVHVDDRGKRHLVATIYGHTPQGEPTRWQIRMRGESTGAEMYDSAELAFEIVEKSWSGP